MRDNSRGDRAQYVSQEAAGGRPFDRLRTPLFASQRLPGDRPSRASRLFAVANVMRDDLSRPGGKSVESAVESYFQSVRIKPAESPRITHATFHSEGVCK